jgi:hypothetical protein
MNKLRFDRISGFFFFWMVLFFPILMLSCESDLVQTNPGDDLTFSQDTVSFDTVFSTIGTPTVWLKVRNKSNSPILIRSISLKNGLNSNFHLLVDGVSGSRFEDVEIASRDSIFLFVALNAVKQGLYSPVNIRDEIVFQTDGSDKSIVLNAFAWDAEFMRGKVLTSDTTLTDDRPYVVYDSLVVAGNATLNIQPGVQLFFHDKAFLKVNGRIVAVGTKNKPIQFRGDRLDKVIAAFPYDFYPGQWDCIYLAPTSSENVFEYVDIHGAYNGVIADSVHQGVQLRMRHCKIHNMINTCIWGNATQMELSNCQISNSGSYTVALIGGHTTLVHCTIANHQWIATREGPALMLVNTMDDGSNANGSIAYPLYARFTNSILSGSHESELGFVKKDGIAWDVQFSHCLIKAAEIPVSYARTDSCFYNLDPKFMKLGSSSEGYICDFRIDSLSPAKDAGTVTSLLDFSTDFNDISRMVDGKPDMGAFEWFPDQK